MGVLYPREISRYVAEKAEETIQGLFDWEEAIFRYHEGATLEPNQIEVNLGVEEIQLYRLKVEAYGDFQGPIKKYKQIHPRDCPPVDEQMLMKQIAIDILADNGYHENLRRVFSRKRKHTRMPAG